MINKDFSETLESLCYRIAQNVLTDSDHIASCIEDAKNRAISSKHNSSSMLSVRLVRHIAFQKFMSAYKSGDTSSYNGNILAIMDELDDVAKLSSSSDNENVIALQLSDTVNVYVRTLTETEQFIYIRRYFFADSIEAIANMCNMSTDNVDDILDRCNGRLVNLLTDKNFTIKKETLFHCFTDISDELISNCTNYVASSVNDAHKHKTTTPKRDDTVTNHEKKERSSHSPFSLVSLVSGIVAIVIIVLLLVLSRGDNNKPSSSIDATSNNSITSTDKAPNNSVSLDQVISSKGDEKFVVIDELLTYSTSDPLMTKDTFTYNKGDLSISYVGYNLTNHNILKECLGTKLTDISDDVNIYYTLLGHDDLEYIIMQKNNAYCFFYKLSGVTVNTKTPTDENSSPPTVSFETVLREVYDIKNANDIKHILVSTMKDYYAPNEDSNILGSVENAETLEKIYNVLKNMTYTDTDISNLKNNYMTFKSHVIDTSVKLDIVTANGSTIDNIHYKFNDKYFFDADNAIFSTVSEDEHLTLCNAFNIMHITEDVAPWNPDAYPLRITKSFTSSYILHLSYQHEDNFISGLYVSDWYEVERLEGDTWVKVKPLEGTPSKETCNALTYRIPANSSGKVSFDIAKKYGELPKGKYRAITSVCYLHTYNTDNHTEKLYYTEFEVRE